MDFKTYFELRTECFHWISHRLKEPRLMHTLGVEDTAIQLSRRYKADANEASIAALLHDNAKQLPLELQEKRLKEGYPELPISKEYSSVYHAFAGAQEAYKQFPSLSKDIINAIAYHTTGRPEMSTLEKIIYCADYIEPGRKDHAGLEAARKAVFDDLDYGMLLILNQTTNYVMENKKKIHPLTLYAIQYYHEQNRRKEFLF